MLWFALRGLFMFFSSLLVFHCHYTGLIVSREWIEVPQWMGQMFSIFLLTGNAEHCQGNEARNFKERLCHQSWVSSSEVISSESLIEPLKMVFSSIGMDCNLFVFWVFTLKDRWFYFSVFIYFSLVPWILIQILVTFKADNEVLAQSQHWVGFPISEWRSKCISMISFSELES